MKVKVTNLCKNLGYQQEIDINVFIAELQEAKALFSDTPKVSLELNYDWCFYEGDTPTIDVFVEGTAL